MGRRAAKATPAPAKKKRAGARGPWLKKVHRAKNGSRYVKNKRG